MHTINEISKKFSISRSTLLYYDSIGLLKPSGRSNANYRLYSDSDFERMEKIRIYRDAGLPLKSIIDVLEQEENEVHSILENQLFITNKKIQELRNQQSVIIKILGSEGMVSNSRVITKARWVLLLKATGLSEADMKKWHIGFERMSPEAHQDFLESLGIEETEIVSIRQMSSENGV